MPLPNPLRTKMELEQRRQALLQLHRDDQQLIPINVSYIRDLTVLKS